MKIKSRAKIILYEENSDAEQCVIMVVNGEHPSAQDFQKVMERYPEARYVGEYVVVETTYGLTD
jgi:hypothetical protein